MRSEGNRKSVILSRMIKARLSSVVCPVAPYVSYFSFTTFQWFVVFFSMLPNVLGIAEGGDFQHKSSIEERKLNLAQMSNRSRSDPLLAIPCYGLPFLSFVVRIEN